MKANIDLIMVCAGCQGPSDKAHLPLGLVYIGTELERNDYNIKIWHLMPEDFENTIPKIKDRGPLWVGLSVLSGVTTRYAAQLSRLIRELIPETQIVWGGNHASAVPEEVVAENYVDFVITGEAEDSSVEFSDTLLTHKDFSKVRNLYYKDQNGKVYGNESRPLEEDLDRYELNWDLVDIDQYINVNNQGKTPVSFYSSRGCPYLCTFCATPYYTGTSYRVHSPDYVLRHLTYLKERYGFNSVFFSDDNFMIHKKRGLEILKRVPAIGTSVDTLDVRLNQLNEPMIKEFHEYNVQGIFFGYESGNDRILKLIKKGVNLDHMKRKVELLSKYNIAATASGYIGNPTETREEAYDTVNFSMWLRDNLPDWSTVQVYRYMPLPKTGLMELAIQEGFEYPQRTEDWDKIDPIGPKYRMKDWIKWLTPEDEEFFMVVQEFSRNKMLNYTQRHSFLVNSINNFFVTKAREKVQSRKAKFDIEYRLFDFSRNLYGKLIGYSRPTMKSEAVKSYQ